jgi:putative intracellular protease/amidase
VYVERPEGCRDPSHGSSQTRPDNWVDEPVVVDGDLVTARWPGDIPAFTDAMMRLIRTR